MELEETYEMILNENVTGKYSSITLILTAGGWSKNEQIINLVYNREKCGEEWI